MRSWIILVVVALAVPARAQSYQDKKDTDAIGVVERSLAKVEKVPSLFDGTAIPADTDLKAVQAFYDQMSTYLAAAKRSFGEMSAKAQQRPEVQRLRAKYDDLERYRAALGPLLASSRSNAEASARKQKGDHRRDVEVATKVCAEFRAELRKTNEDYEAMGVLTNLVDGHPVFWQTSEEGAKFKGALERTAATCKRMPTASAACVTASNVAPLDARYCETAAKGDELLKAGVKNLIAFTLKNSGPASITADFERVKGWLDVDGVISWTAYFTGVALRERLTTQITPLLAQANMAPADGAALLDAIAAEFAQLEAKARELGPTWELPGDACAGPGCAQAKQFVQKWYGGAKIVRFQHTKPGWKIIANALNIPKSRDRYGFALIKVAGEPFCQLRMWTLSEQYSGSGTYTAARGVQLGAVRWQACK